MSNMELLSNIIKKQAKVEDKNPTTPNELLMKPLANFIDKHGMIALRKKRARHSNYIINGHQFWRETVNAGLSELYLLAPEDLGSLDPVIDHMIDDTKQILKLLDVKNYQDVDTYHIYNYDIADIQDQLEIIHLKRKPSFNKVKQIAKDAYNDINLITQRGFELDSVFYLKNGYRFNGLDIKRAYKLISNAYSVRLVPKTVINKAVNQY